MKLTVQQINQLYDFTSKHFVEHYDLQTELVDHLANGIEQQWSQNPNISFDEALGKEFKKFGIFGFSDIIEKRAWMLEKKYWRFIGKCFLSFFRLPKIIFTLFLVGLTYQLLYFSTQNQMDYLLFVFIIPLVIVSRKAYTNRKEYNIKIKSGHKKWMLEEHIINYGSGLIIINLFAQILVNGRYVLYLQNLPNMYLIFLSVFISLFFVLGYIMIFYIPKKAHLYLEENYQEYKFS